MSTATAKTPAQAAYSGERRSTAAKWGWAFRRAVPTPPDAETIARARLEALVADADPAVARLYACDVAETVTRAGDDAGCFNQPYHSAANAASWCTDRDIRRGGYWSLIWAAGCAEYGRRTETLERYCDGLDARIRATK